ncbi:MAG: hypothetical protein OEQ30_11675 [Gammaproteobacteria bacterium]|jgi:hypothetical protein|nr:hypothetical protein [Gammaproteobacteria bacterium]
MRSSLPLLLCLLSPAAASLAADGADPDPLFQSHETLDVTLSAPLTTLVRDRPTEEYVQGTLAHIGDDGEVKTFDVKVRARGHSRNEICDLPPLWLNFKKSQVKDTLFHKQNKLKLAVHCGDADRYEQTLLREYVAYRILNLATPLSFQLRLLRITWVDTEGKREQQVRYAFLLEHKNRVGKRIDRKDLKIDETSVAALDPVHLNLTSVFQFLIGNTDFSPIAKSEYNECCHNYVLFSNDSDLLIGIPYDFDQAGIVSAPYAIPGAQFDIRTVRHRVYRGRCDNNDHVENSIERFKAVRNNIFALIQTQDGLTPRVRKIITNYVQDFYDIADDPRQIERRMIEKCVF